METIEKIKAIINNENVSKTFFNLFDRWRDESKYEDINEYGKCLYSTMNKEFPNFGIEYISASKRPFGLKVKIDNKTFKLHTKLKGRYIVLCASKV